MDNKGKYTNRNLWDEEWELGDFSNGLPTSSSTSIRSKNYIKMQRGVGYYLYAPRAVLFCWYDENKNYLGSNGVDANRAMPNPPLNCAYAKIRVASTTTYANNICINVSDTNNGSYSAYLSGKATMPKLGVQKGDNVITTDTEVKPTKIKAKI